MRDSRERVREGLCQCVIVCQCVCVCITLMLLVSLMRVSMSEASEASLRGSCCRMTPSPAQLYRLWTAHSPGPPGAHTHTGRYVPVQHTHQPRKHTYTHSLVSKCFLHSSTKMNSNYLLYYDENKLLCNDPLLMRSLGWAHY